MLYSSLRESVSIRGRGATGEGKGGALFFHTTDRRFVVKTVSNSEAQFLQATLPQLCQHLARNPYSLLLPLCALVKLDVSGTVLRAVVMPNLFFPSVDERFVRACVRSHGAVPRAMGMNGWPCAAQV